MIQIGRHYLIVIFVSLFLSGCAVHDSRYGSVLPNSSGIASINGTYSNLPIYPTHKDTGYPKDYEYINSLTSNLGLLTTKGIDRVQLKVLDDGSLIASSFAGGVKKAEKQLPTKPASLNNLEKLVIDTDVSGAGGDSSLQLGLETRRWEVFADSQGNLIFQESGGGAGLFLVLPYVVSVKNIYIYKRIESAP